MRMCKSSRFGKFFTTCSDTAAQQRGGGHERVGYCASRIWIMRRIAEECGVTWGVLHDLEQHFCCHLRLLSLAGQVQAGDADVARVVPAEVLDQVEAPEVHAGCPHHPAARCAPHTPRLRFFQNPM